MMLALLGAGSIALVVNAIAFEDSTYKSPIAFTDALLAELHVDRATAEAYVKAHPEVIFEPGASADTPTGKSVNAAFQNAQRRVQLDAVSHPHICAATS